MEGINLKPEDLKETTEKKETTERFIQYMCVYMCLHLVLHCSCVPVLSLALYCR